MRVVGPACERVRQRGESRIRALRPGRRGAAPGHGSKVMERLAAPRVAQKPPLGHASHVTAPRLALYAPGGHDEHFAPLPSTDEDVPGAHLMQDSLLAAPVEGRYCP